MTDQPPASLAESDAPHYHGHRERLRERFLNAPGAVPDYEILELLLASVIPRRDVKPMAKAMLDRWGSLADVLSADVEELMGFDGMGKASATVLKVIPEAAFRLARAPLFERSVLSQWDTLLDYCNTTMSTLPTEHVRLLFLDKKHKLIQDEIQQRGTVDHTPLYPREVVRRALELHASSVIMVHNHPSGDPTPSKNDIEVTRQVRDALRTMNILLIDHVIVGRNSRYSFKSMGLI